GDDAYAGSAHATVLRCAAGAEVVQQPRNSRPDEGRYSDAEYWRSATQSAAAVTVKPLVTITRQYASGGSEIGRLVVERLGWTLIDNEFVDQVARLAGLSTDEVARREERAPGLLARLARTSDVALHEQFVS